MKVKLDKYDMGIIINSLDAAKYLLTEYSIEDQDYLINKWLSLYHKKSKGMKVNILEEQSVIIKSLNLFRNKYLNHTSKREIIDDLIIKLSI